MKDNFIGIWNTPSSLNPMDMVGRKGEQDIDALCFNIKKKLAIKQEDIVLDLCCGNGIISHKLATCCKKVVGVDFSKTLLDQAKKINSLENIEYLFGDALNLSVLLKSSSIDKCCMPLAIQYFDPATTLDKLFTGFNNVIKPNGLILITDIPDESKKFVHKVVAFKRLLSFSSKHNGQARFPTFGSRLRYLTIQFHHLLTGPSSDNRLGWWWNKDKLKEAALVHGMECEIFNQGPESGQSHYRFDALLTVQAKQPVRNLSTI